ncbi:hypothetical protein AB0K92_25175 [Streptomyces sp. NPDC052687]|uniref:hypothetical protein n=1 Tax=Streptomyces sp. NPDC052687 TaxID=3154759 RepID=UPI0034184E87
MDHHGHPPSGTPGRRAPELPPGEEDAVRARVLGGLRDLPPEVRARIRRLLTAREGGPSPGGGQ